MTVESFQCFLPEIGVLIAAGVVLILGQAGGAGWRALVAPLTLASLLAAMVYGFWISDEAVGVSVMGFKITPLSIYTRHIVLALGALMVMVAWNLPTTTERGDFFAMVLFSIAGVMLTASAEDLVTFFFAIELVSVPTYVLVASGSSSIRAQESGMKYFFLGALSAALMVYGFSFLYGVSGTTTLSAGTMPSPGGQEPTMAGILQSTYQSHGRIHVYAIIGLVLAFGGLAFKLAAVPLHFYVADVYQGAPSPVTGMLGFLPKFAGLIAVTKLLALTGWQWAEALFWMLWAVAALSMTVGNVLALLQTNVKRILAYSSIAHSGYMLIGVLVGPLAGAGPMRDGIAAMLFYVAIYGVTNLGAFAVLSYLTSRGKPVEELEDLAGLSRSDAIGAMVMAVCVFSLMGMPPLAGFLGKVYVFASAFSASADSLHGQAVVVLAVIGVINSAIAAAYYLRIVGTCYPIEPVHPVAAVRCAPLRLAMVLCAILAPALFVWPNNILSRARLATRGLVAQPADSEQFRAGELDKRAAGSADATIEAVVNSQLRP